ncbi:MAG: hypothetical protein AAB594_01330 [Patescibacteria group bacterium]
MPFIHQNLAQDGWQKLSFMEQLGNIGSEVGRAANAQSNDQTKFENARLRALELLDLTLDDPRWKGRLKEIARAREVFCDTTTNQSREYHANLKDLEKYFFAFALLVRK